MFGWNQNSNQVWEKIFQPLQRRIYVDIFRDIYQKTLELSPGLYLEFCILGQDSIRNRTLFNFERKALKNSMYYFVRKINTFPCLLKVRTLSPISLSGLSTIRYKTTLNTGSVGWAGAAPPTCELGKFLSWPLALSMSTYTVAVQSLEIKLRATT